MTENRKTCFIITPIGGDKDSIRRHIDGVIDEAIIPIFKSEYDVLVSHRINKIGSINKQVLKLIYDSDIVIANLTGLNPNVMYELSFRHSTGKPVIAIAEHGTKIPFDVIDSRTIFYRNDPVGMKELRESLSKFYKEIDFKKNEYGPIYDALKLIALEEKAVLDLNDFEEKNKKCKIGNSFELLLKKMDELEANMYYNRYTLISDLTNPGQVYIDKYIQTAVINRAKNLKEQILYVLSDKGIQKNKIEYLEQYLKALNDNIEILNDSSLTSFSFNKIICNLKDIEEVVFNLIY